MSVELISVLVAVLAIGATLAVVILTSNRGLRKDMRDDMKQGESRLREDMGKLESRLRDDTSLLRDDIKQLGERVARVEHSQAKTRRVAGRIARGHHRAGQGQLGTRAAMRRTTMTVGVVHSPGLKPWLHWAKNGLPPEVLSRAPGANVVTPEITRGPFNLLPNVCPKDYGANNA